MARSLARMAVPALDANRVALLAKNNVTITAVEPLGARVSGIDFRSGQKPSPTVVAALQVCFVSCWRHCPSWQKN